MPTYEFWYSETDTFKAWFDAKNIRQAEKLLEEVFSGSKSVGDLPNFDNNSKDYDADYDPDSLRRCD